jgi:hypothetical protein
MNWRRHKHNRIGIKMAASYKQAANRSGGRKRIG